MKKTLALLLLAALLAAPALACTETRVGDWMFVTNCEEYISLREDPSTDAAVLDRMPLDTPLAYLGPAGDRFARVLYDGQTGYALESYLKNLHVICEDCLPRNLNDTELYNLQIFLSNFTEQGMCRPADVVTSSILEDPELVDFAINHIWFNRKDKLEWGEYADGCNVRVKADALRGICEKYFGYEFEFPISRHFTYNEDDGYFYWQETGGHMADGFACVTEARDMGDGRLRVSFRVYGGGDEWDESVYSMNENALRANMPHYISESAPVGDAVIRTNGDLMDRSAWKLDRIAIDWQPAQ